MKVRVTLIAVREMDVDYSDFVDDDGNRLPEEQAIEEDENSIAEDPLAFLEGLDCEVTVKIEKIDA